MRSGWFDHVCGVGLGSFADGGDPEVVTGVLTDRLSVLGIPVIAGFGFGHHRDNLSVPLECVGALDPATRSLSIGSARP